MSDAYQRILLVTDGSPAARVAEQTAADFARQFDAEVIVADTMRVPGLVESWLDRTSTPTVQLLIKDKTEHLNSVAAQLKEQGVAAISTSLLRGRSSEQLTGEVIAKKCDLLIRYRKGVDSRRRGLFGTTAMNLLRFCPCPVLLVDEHHSVDASRVLACVDVADANEVNDEIMRHAIRIAAEAGVYVLSCWEMLNRAALYGYMEPEAYEQLLAHVEENHCKSFDELLARYDLDAGNPNVAMQRGLPRDLIPAFVSDHSIGLTVMSTVAPGSLGSRFLGTTIESVMPEIAGGLLAVKPQGFVSPIHLESDSGSGSFTMIT